MRRDNLVDLAAFVSVAEARSALLVEALRYRGSRAKGGRTSPR
jgi:hypothetical protein